MKSARTILTALMACLAWATHAQAVLLVQVSSVSDMTLPAWSMGDPAVNAAMDMCVYATLAPSGGYGITASAPGGFVLKNGSNSIPYSLSWDDGGAGNLGSSAQPLTNNVKLAGRANANIVSPVCLGGANARLNLSITQAAMTAALSGTYSSTITLVVTPN